jgi:acyl transferase domain-containing protein
MNLAHHRRRMADWLNYTQGGIVNVDGRCKPFDADADGYARDHIDGVIRC